METSKSNYELYLERYCKTYGLTPEEAEQHYVVRDVKKYYEESESEQ